MAGWSTYGAPSTPRAKSSTFQKQTDKRAALKLMRKLLKKMGFTPERLVTDDLRSYGAAARDLGISHRHERGRWRNNRRRAPKQSDELAPSNVGHGPSPRGDSTQPAGNGGLFSRPAAPPV
jgi:hypothetical protein